MSSKHYRAVYCAGHQNGKVEFERFCAKGAPVVSTRSVDWSNDVRVPADKCLLRVQIKNMAPEGLASVLMHRVTPRLSEPHSIVTAALGREVGVALGGVAKQDLCRTGAIVRTISSTRRNPT